MCYYYTGHQLEYLQVWIDHTTIPPVPFGNEDIKHRSLIFLIWPPPHEFMHYWLIQSLQCE